MVQTLNRRSNTAAPSERIERKSEARRLEILRAAGRVFRRLGISGTGIREIADEAGLLPGNLYYYFSGKDEILLYCQERTLERLLAAAREASRAAGPVGERLRSVIRAHVHCMLDELEGATAHLEIEALPDELRAPLVKKRDAYERAVRSLVTDGVKRGEFAADDPSLVTRAMLGAVNWTARWYRPDGPQSVSEIAAALSEYLVRGLAKSPLPPFGKGGTQSPGWPDAIYRVLRENSVRQVAYVPDAGHARLIDLCRADRAMRAVPLTTEEEGIAQLAGAWLGGERGVLLLQSSGVGNCINMLSLPVIGRFPLLMLVTMRGEWAEFNPWQVPMGRATQPALEAIGLRVMRAEHPADLVETVGAAAAMAYEADQQVAVLIGQRLLGKKKW